MAGLIVITLSIFLLRRWLSRVLIEHEKPIYVPRYAKPFPKRAPLELTAADIDQNVNCRCVIVEQIKDEFAEIETFQ